MKVHIFFALVVLHTFTVSAQDRTAPDYLTSQSFPDSVKHTIVMSLEGIPYTLEQVLSEFEGRKVFIDIWASWCRDCVVSVPKYKKLRKKLQGEEVTYLLLSVDKEDEKWKGAIKKYSLQGEHYRLADWKTPFTNYIELDWIPRYLILDENGKVILPKSVKVEEREVYEKLVGKGS